MNVQDLSFSATDIRSIVRQQVEHYSIASVDGIVGLAVDNTLDYVVEWLEQRGNHEIASDLIDLKLE